MARVELDVDTSLAPDRLIDALTDFSERRPDVWPDLERSQYEVYSVEATSASVREGSKLPGTTIWAKERYDWSAPGTVRWTVEESNFCAPGSYVAVTARPSGSGGSRIHVEWDRTGTSFVGKLVVGMVKVSNGGPLKSSLRKAFHRLETPGA